MIDIKYATEVERISVSRTIFIVSNNILYVQLTPPQVESIIVSLHTIGLTVALLFTLFFSVLTYKLAMLSIKLGLLALACLESIEEQAIMISCTTLPPVEAKRRNTQTHRNAVGQAVQNVECLCLVFMPCMIFFSTSMSVINTYYKKTYFHHVAMRRLRSRNDMKLDSLELSLHGK